MAWGRGKFLLVDKQGRVEDIWVLAEILGLNRLGDGGKGNCGCPFQVVAQGQAPPNRHTHTHTPTCKSVNLCPNTKK